MANYKIQIKKTAQKEIQALSIVDRKRVIAKIQSLASDPRAPECLKLSRQERYRVRVGVYRILYEIQDEVLCIMVVKVAHRKNAYR